MDVNPVIDYVKEIPPVVGAFAVGGLSLAIFSLHNMTQLNRSVRRTNELEEELADSVKHGFIEPYSMSVGEGMIPRSDEFLEATRGYFKEEGVEPQMIGSYEVYDCNKGRVIIEGGTVNVRSVDFETFFDLVGLMNGGHS